MIIHKIINYYSKNYKLLLSKFWYYFGKSLIPLIYFLVFYKYIFNDNTEFCIQDNLTNKLKEAFILSIMAYLGYFHPVINIELIDHVPDSNSNTNSNIDSDNIDNNTDNNSNINLNLLQNHDSS